MQTQTDAQTDAMTAPRSASEAPPDDEGAAGHVSDAARLAVAVGPGWRLPTLRSPMSPSQAMDALDQLARKGSLPGLAALACAGKRKRFRVAIFGEPFDRALEGAVAPADQGAGCEIAFAVKLLRKAPILLVGGTIIAIWPGLPMLDKMIPPAWNWWPTWTWYLPLVILPTIALTPVLWRRSERAARDHAREQLERIAGALRAEAKQA